MSLQKAMMAKQPLLRAVLVDAELSETGSAMICYLANFHML